MNESVNVAYCGLFCGDCIIRGEKIADVSQNVLEIIDAPEFQKLLQGLPLISPEAFENLTYVRDAKYALKAMCNLDCYHPCKEGGGGASCEIRICCKEKKLNGCWECEQMETCTVLAAIYPVHQGANVRNMKIIREQGMDAFLAGEKYW